MTSSHAPDLTALADAVLAATTDLKQALAEPDTPESTIESRSDAFSTATTALNTALNGPASKLYDIAMSQFDLLALDFFLDYRIVEHLSLDAGVALADIAEKIGVDENRTGRLLRHLATHGLLREHVGVFYLTPDSVVLKDPMANATLSMITDDMTRPSAFSTAAIRKNPHSAKVEHAPWAEAWGAPQYEWYKSQPAEREERFALTQEGMTTMYKPNTLVLDWAKNKLTAPSGVILDIGGGNGHISIGLSKHLPSYSFEVQDNSPKMFEASAAANADLPHITFRQHDYFNPQPAHEKPVLAIILRHVLHTWNDEKAAKILQALVPTMQAHPQARILVNDTVMVEPGAVHPLRERKQRYFDMVMMVVANARQRTESEWRQLVHGVKGLVVEEVLVGGGGPVGVVVVRYEGEAKGA